MAKYKNYSDKLISEGNSEEGNILLYAHGQMSVYAVSQIER